MLCHPYYEDIVALTSSIESWKDLGPDQLKFERLTGLSNKIWKVTALRPTVTPQAVIFRKFGSSGLVDRNKENYILRELGANRSAAKFYAGTDEYRIEKFYDSDHLNPEKLLEVPFRNQVAKAVGELHRVDLSEMDKTPEFLKVLNQREMMKKAQKKAKLQELFTSEEREMIHEILTLTNQKEISFLRSIVPKGPNSVVFSHNDLHSENILCLKKDRRLLLIDYEYSSYNYRGYDIANFFNESLFEYHNGVHPYFTINEDKFPEKEELVQFIKYYLFFYKFSLARGKELDDVLSDGNKLMEYVEKHGDVDAFLEEVEEIYKEVQACCLFSHYYWILWSIVMSKRPDIKFDYIPYAYKRYQLYRKLKARFMGLDREDEVTSNTAIEGLKAEYLVSS